MICFLFPFTLKMRDKLQQLGVSMNTETDIFSSPKSHENEMTQALTERLYGGPIDASISDAYDGKKAEDPTSQAWHETTSRFIAKELKLDYQSSQALERRIESFQQSQTDLTLGYLLEAENRTTIPDFCFYYLNGWQKQTTKSPSEPLLLTEQSRKMSGGLFIRWNGKGIVINPGKHFLKNFHDQGLHLHDIDFVIVTGSHPEAYADVRAIYELSYQLNKASSELHIINYYFNQHAYLDLSGYLKPHFKQERNTLHSLELFVDSPDVEKIELSEGITLNYFLVAARDAFSSNNTSFNQNIHSPGAKDDRSAPALTSVGLKLDLKHTPGSHHEKGGVRIGYISHAAWNPFMAHHLGSCDILMTSFGHTCPNDYNKISYNPDSLGYYGTYTLLEEVAPKLLLTGEFSGREGDIRLEVLQKMRQEFAANTSRSSKHNPVLLPADHGMIMNLASLQMKCSISNAWVDPAQIKAIKTSDTFGKLMYLSPHCCF